jgi:predicted nuclease of predicted toxin-antitoxin system
MRFLADENFPKLVIDQLRREEHDVTWAGTDFQSTEDRFILSRAENEGRILLTLDRDFWQLAVQQRKHLRRSGVILFRVHPATPNRVGELVRIVLDLKNSWVGQVALVTPQGIDIVPAGRTNHPHT